MKKDIVPGDPRRWKVLSVRRENPGVDRWEQGAVKHPGAVAAAAKREGLTVHQWAMKHQHDKGSPAATLRGRRARLALLFERQAKAHGRGVRHYHGRTKNPKGMYTAHAGVYRESFKTKRAAQKWAIDKMDSLAERGYPRTDLIVYKNEGQSGEKQVWYFSAEKQKSSPEDRLKRNPDRLHDAIIVLPNRKRVKGKAKYDSKSRRVRMFVPEKYAH